MPTLSEKQQIFSRMLNDLLSWLFENGYEVTFGEVKRLKAQADANAAAGTGIKNSLHLISLAVDLNIFRDGVFLTSAKDIEPAGIFWESIGGSWGGRFKNVDANHFSLEHNGVR